MKYATSAAIKAALCYELIEMDERQFTGLTGHLLCLFTKANIFIISPSCTLVRSDLTPLDETVEQQERVLHTSAARPHPSHHVTC